MKTLKLISAILIIIFFVGCYSTSYYSGSGRIYNEKKIAVLINVHGISFTKDKNQHWFINEFMNNGEKYYDALNTVEGKFDIYNPLVSRITNTFKAKNKKFQFIHHNLLSQPAGALNINLDDNLLIDKDLNIFLKEHNIDELMTVDVNYGLYASYWVIIPWYRRGFANIEYNITNLSDDRILRHVVKFNSSRIKGNWKDGKEFENLKISIQNAINSTIKRIL